MAINKPIMPSSFSPPGTSEGNQKEFTKKTIDIRSGRRVDNMIGILIDLLGKLYAGGGLRWGGGGGTLAEYRYEPWLYLNTVFVQEMQFIPV